MSGVRRAAAPVGAVLLAAVVLGAALSAVKGGGTGWRHAVGDAWAWWVLLPLVAGCCARRLPGAAALGAAAEVVGLLGFYAANAVVLDLGVADPVRRLRLALAPAPPWLLVGAVTGVLVGPLGGLAGRLLRGPATRSTTTRL